MGRRIGLMQVDPTVGDLNGNAARIGAFGTLGSTAWSQYWSDHRTCYFGIPSAIYCSRKNSSLCQQSASSLNVPIPVLVGTPIEPQGKRQLPGNGVVRAGLSEAHPSGEGNSHVVARKQLLPYLRCV